MKATESSFQSEKKQACICGKEKKTIKVNMIFLRRVSALGGLGIAGFVIAVAAIGLRETLAVASIPAAILAAGILAVLVVTTYQLMQGHTLKCSARRAVLTVL